MQKGYCNIISIDFKLYTELLLPACNYDSNCNTNAKYCSISNKNRSYRNTPKEADQIHYIRCVTSTPTYWQRRTEMGI